LKVTLLNTDDYTGGAAIACRRLLSALDNEPTIDSEMVVLTSKSKQDKIVELDTNYAKKKLSWLRFVLERLYFLPFEKNKQIRFLFNPGLFGKRINKKNRIVKSDIVHLHWINFGFLSIKSIENILDTGKPVVWTLHDMWSFTGGCHHSGTCENYIVECGNCIEFLKKPSPNDLSHTIWKRKLNSYSNTNITVVCCSNWLAERAKKSSIFRNHPIISIPNPIDTSIFHPIEKDIAQTKLGLDKDKIYILIVAMKIDAVKKGYTYFQEAIKSLENTHNKEIEIITIGQINESTDFNLKYKVNSFGKITDIEKIVLVYSAATVFVIPSLEENLPNTIMEALSCGTPVVGFNIGGIPEMIDHKVNGYVAEYKSVKDLSNGIDWVIQHAESNGLNQNAREKALKNYDEKVIAHQYSLVYQRLLAANNKN
jgi:glycosyltransferase involved in cell wall biosynthesis